MFNSNDRAFYKLAESFPLDKIETKHYIPWVQNLFSRKNVHLPAELIEEIVAGFENHPMYTQNFLFHLWEEPGKKRFSPEIICLVYSNAGMMNRSDQLAHGKTRDLTQQV